MQNRNVLLLSIVLPVFLYGCGKPPSVGPHLVSASDQQRGRIEPVANDRNYGSIVDNLTAVAQDVMINSQCQLVESIANTGSPSTGLRILFKGTAFSQGLFGAPKSLAITSTLENGHESSSEDTTIARTADGQGYILELPTFSYGKTISISMCLQAVRGGKGDVQIYVISLDPKSQGDTSFQRSYNVMSEQSDSPSSEIVVPQ